MLLQTEPTIVTRKLQCNISSKSVQ